MQLIEGKQMGCVASFSVHKYHQQKNLWGPFHITQTNAFPTQLCIKSYFYNTSFFFLRYKVTEINGTKKGTYSYSFQYIFQRKVNKNWEKGLFLFQRRRDKHVIGLFFIN